MDGRTQRSSIYLKNIILSLFTILVGCASPTAVTATSGITPATTTTSQSLALPSPIPVPTETLKVTEVKPHLKKLDYDPDRFYVFKGRVEKKSANAFINKLIEFEAVDKKKPITVVIDSEGGAVTDGFRIIAAMDATAPEIRCVVDSGAYSMAASIFLACDKGYMLPQAEIMYHSGSFRVGDERHRAKNLVDHIMKMFDKMDQWNADKLGLPLEVYLDNITYEWYLTPEEAVEHGAADQVLDSFRYKTEEEPTNLLENFFKLP